MSNNEYEQQQFWKDEEKLQCIYWENNPYWVNSKSVHDSIALLIKTINNEK